jgi:uncharacterized protein YdhG (YjbR/CyaY superfamily)/ribosomal protein S18 acetylase RimI-like enzyme
MTSDPAEISSRPVAEHTSTEVAAALTRSFEGYLVPIQMTAQAYERRFRGEDLDPFASRVYSAGGSDAPIGLVLVARRGWTSRIAAMGLAPEARGQGLGRRLLSEAVEEARARGDRAVLLEVIEQNTPAVRLYASFGFQAARRLFGYRKERRESTAPPPDPQDVLSELDPLDFSRIAAREGDRDLPWMLAAETLSAASHPARAFHLEGRAFALISDPGSEMIALSALVVPRAERRQGLGSRLVRALEAAFPGKTWGVSAIVPEDLAPGFFPKLGWERQKLNQFEMRLELVEPGNLRTAKETRMGIDEYIAGFPKDVQEILAKIRETVRKAAPDAEEAIKYQIPTFILKGNLVHFAAFEKHIGFYPTPTGIEKFKEELSAYKSAKGSVQFPLDKPIPFDLISRIVKFRVKESLEKTKAKEKKK